MSKNNIYPVLAVRQVTEHAFVVRMEPLRTDFEPGQHVSVSIAGSIQAREYSIYSGKQNDYLEILVKEVQGGALSPKLKRLKPGDLLEVHGAYGQFVTLPAERAAATYLFIATGTGIAPFHSMITTYGSAINYTLLHGVRYLNERYEHEAYEPTRYVACVSKHNDVALRCRVTDYIAAHDFLPNTVVYLCGNSNMIFEVVDLLKLKGFKRNQIHCEVYF